ncbi:MAG TPA: radical SAM family heme chaperone HemW [Meiothermus sp.]|nr:radical SAM family heme chaperone HemW [Meiothermus sp.]
MEGLYVHVPFCPTICPYCDFHVVRRQSGVVEAYLERLAEEARALHTLFPLSPRTLYFGGGTPSFLRNRELEQLFRALPWDVQSIHEVTMEANPGTLNRERLELLKNLGVNRLSIGVQSFQDGVLKTLGRAHGRKGALEAVEMSLKAGFRTSVDLILGLPEQDYAADLREAATIGVGHVSAYTLQIEPGTPFKARHIELDSDLEASAFAAAEEILGEAGLIRYEVSNFAKPGQESKHNRIYWRAGYWGALGPGASGQYPAQKAGGKEVYSVRLTHPPLPRWLVGEEPSLEPVSPLEHAKEALMLGLRLREGVDVSEIEQRTGLGVWGRLEPVVRELEVQELLWTQNKKIGATRGGLALLHRIILRLWEPLEG